MISNKQIQREKGTTNLIQTMLLVLVIILTLTLSGFMIRNFMYRQVIYLDNSISEIYSTSFQDANNFYILARDSYIIQNYDDVINNCVIARGHFSDEVQEYRVLKAGIKFKFLTVPKLYYQLLNEKIAMENDMYEVCEHLESASKSYNKYYFSDVAYDDPSYQMGTDEIELMNEKIKEHDRAVGRHNDLLAEIANAFE